VGIAVGLERYVLAMGSTLLILVILHVMHRFEPPHNDQGHNGAHEDLQGFKHADTARPT
jgi:uncharacterized membrane protein YhiD involved in acid resistance